ncbi:MAG: homoserine O-acetyltransferase [Gammaproteobacteria bacterium]|nr:homoserine O-acetyltransferase [Gammaproteobacteria bacterium]
MAKRKNPTLSIPPATQFVRLSELFHFRDGQSIADMRIAYETWGKLSARKDNALMVFTGMSPSAHVAASEADNALGWWEGMVGSGCPIDTDRWFVICVNPIGSCFGSTGPPSVDNKARRLYGSHFPLVTVEDIANGIVCVLDELNIDVLKIAMAPSMGGSTAMALSAMNPGRVQNAIFISCAMAASPFSIALRSLQREIIRADPVWSGGDYGLDKQPVTGMKLARKLGMATYRSPKEWQTRFNRKRVPFDGDNLDISGPQNRTSQLTGKIFEVEAYLQARADDFVSRFDANSYLQLSRALDLFDFSEHGEGSFRKAIEKTQWQNVAVMGVATDLLFPLWQQQNLAESADRAGVKATYREIVSDKGHDAFLSDRKLFYPHVKRFMKSL